MAASRFAEVTFGAWRFRASGFEGHEAELGVRAR